MIRVFLFLLVFVATPAFAEDKAELDAQYIAMLESAYTMPENFDFMAMRELFAKTSFYKPYSVAPSIDFKRFFGEQDRPAAVVAKELDEYVKNNFVYGQVHSRARQFYKTKGNDQKRMFHEWAAEGFLMAIVNSGKPWSRETAPKVLIIPEEYMVARNFIESVEEQRLIHHEGKAYDVLIGKSKKDGKDLELWFEITPRFLVEDPFK